MRKNTGTTAVVKRDKRSGGGALRKRKVVSTLNGTQWQTANGGLFIEPVQRPDGDQVVIGITLPRNCYRVLEVLHDDVARYIERLVRSHVEGLIKSAKHNAKVKQNGNVA